MKLSAPPPPPPPSDGTPGAAPGAPDEQPNPTPAPTPDVPTTAAPAPAPATGPKPATWPAWYGGIDSALVGLVVAFAFVAASFAARNSDLWVNLASGQRLFSGQYFPGGGDPFSYTAEGRTWVNHSWLADALMYLLYGGSGGVLVAAKAVVVAAAFGLLIAIRRPGFALWPWAAVACVAVLACAPQFTLRPFVASLLLFAVTLFLLFRLPHKPGSWRFPAAIGVTFWLWANSDQWFFVGPLALALLLFGDLIQKYGFGTPDEPPETPPDEPLGRLPDTATLAKALGIGVLACTLTPHHVLIWELPFELTGAPAADADPRLRAALLAPHDSQYVNNAGWGYNLNGLAYAVLFAAGGVVFGLGPGRVRAAHVALWVGLAVLSLLSVVAIPFFALAAVPLVAAQLNAFSARAELRTWGDPRTRLLLLGSSLGRVLAVPAVCALGVLAYPGWVHPEASNPAFARRVAWAVEPDPASVRAAERVGGWRQSGALPADARGFVTNIELANYLAWYAPGERVFVNGRLRHHRRELAEYVAVRKGLGLLRAPDEEPDAAAADAVLAARGAEYVAVHAGAGEGTGARLLAQLAAQQLMLRWGRWAAWYTDGRTAVFGWRPAAGEAKPSFAALRLDPAAEAFGPGVRPAPDPELKQPLKPAETDAEALVQGFVRPARPTPAGAHEALGWMQYKEAVGQRREVRRQLAQFVFHTLPAVRDTFHPVAVFGADAVGLLRFPPARPADPAAAALQADADAGRAAPLLAVRAARRAIADDPDHPDGYYALGLALADPDLPLGEGERALGMATAYRQCLQRLPRPDRYKRGQFLATGTDAARQLALVYLGQNVGWRDPRGREVLDFTGFPVPPPFDRLFGQPLFREPNGALSRGRPASQGAQPVNNGAPYLLPADLAREALQTALEYAPRDLAGESDERLKAAVKQLEAFRKAVEDVVLRYKDRYDAGRAGAKLPALVDRAVQSCLLGEALRLLSDKDADLGKEYGKDAAGAAVLRVGLELAVGRVEDAADNLKVLSGPELAGALAQSPAAPLAQLLKYQKAVLAGEYKLAGDLWEAMSGQVGPFADLPPPGPAVPLRYVLPALQAVTGGRDPARLLPPALAPPLTFAPGHAQPVQLFFWQGSWDDAATVLLQRVRGQLAAEANFFARRGVLFLLEGDIPAAQDRFRQAARKAPAGWGPDEPAPPLAQEYLRLIERAGR